LTFARVKKENLTVFFSSVFQKLFYKSWWIVSPKLIFSSVFSKPYLTKCRLQTFLKFTCPQLFYNTSMILFHILTLSIKR
jgi:hypothetical protein